MTCFWSQMKELKHENLVQFFGVCTEPPNVCIVLQYCRKGSLRVSDGAAVLQERKPQGE